MAEAAITDKERRMLLISYAIRLSEAAYNRGSTKELRDMAQRMYEIASSLSD